ncbi:50S ribosomal protein L6 [bioreactor metagenome]|uniref:50S ribosomal protein L6 n=1 Tax=bioreactor metagenome TaxID=1076179 RepID=A0A644Y1F0_9ZZZZ
MSRIGKKPIAIPKGIKVALQNDTVTVEGKEKLSLKLPVLVDVEVTDTEVHVKQQQETLESSAMQGLARALIHNMVVGLSTGFKKELSIIGVGYKAQLSGSKLVLNLGYSHPIEYHVPAGIKVNVADGVKITIEGADKQQVGQVAATIRGFRAPEPYKGKGIRYVDEQIILKEGKTVG